MARSGFVHKEDHTGSAIAATGPTKTVTEDGGQYSFRDQPPACPTAKSDLDITKVGTKHTPKDSGHDTYVDFPGDGITPG